MTADATFEVDAAEDGRRLDVVVAARLGEPRAQVQRRILDGEVTVDEQPVPKSHRVTLGERIAVVPRRTPAEASAPPAVPVRYTDEHLLIVAKPAGLVVHAGAGVTGGTLVDALRAQGVTLATAGDPERPGIVHRLDRGTSGLLAVAKTDEAFEGLTALLRRREVDRGYWALVEGVPYPPRATIDAPIGRDPDRRTRFRTDQAGRAAVTHYDVVDAYHAVSRLDVRLETGRTHQVRVHMAAVGHPVAGDRLYGGSTSLASRLGLERPALHAAHLAFDHPVTCERIDVDEPLPGDLTQALERAEKGPLPG